MTRTGFVFGRVSFSSALEAESSRKSRFLLQRRTGPFLTGDGLRCPPSDDEMAAGDGGGADGVCEGVAAAEDVAAAEAVGAVRANFVGFFALVMLAADCL